MKRVKLRKILVGILVVLTRLSITVTTVDTWAHRTLLNTDEWVDTVGPLGTDPQVKAALANFVTTQIVTTLDLEKRAHDVLEQERPAGGVPRRSDHQRDRGVRARQVGRVLRFVRLGDVVDGGEPHRAPAGGEHPPRAAREPS